MLATARYKVTSTSIMLIVLKHHIIYIFEFQNIRYYFSITGKFRQSFIKSTKTTHKNDFKVLPVMEKYCVN